MRQGTGYTYGSSEDCISYKCEGCGRRVRVTPAQVPYTQGTYMACSRVCVLKARDIRAQQWHQAMHASASPHRSKPPEHVP